MPFCIGEDTRVWAHWTHMYVTHLTCLGPVSYVHSLSFLRALCGEWLQSNGCYMAGLLSSLSSPRLTSSLSTVAAISDDSDNLCLLIMRCRNHPISQLKENDFMCYETWRPLLVKYLQNGDWLSSKKSACNTRDISSIPGLGRSPGGGNGYPLQYSCLENPMDRGAWWARVHRVAKSRIDWSDWA